MKTGTFRSTLCERPWPALWNRCQFRHPEMTKFTLCPSEATPELWHSRTLPGEVTRHSHKLGTTRYLQDQFCGLFKVPESKTKKQHDGRCLINTLVKALTLLKEFVDGIRGPYWKKILQSERSMPKAKKNPKFGGQAKKKYICHIKPSIDIAKSFWR